MRSLAPIELDPSTLSDIRTTEPRLRPRRLLAL
jgi:hypothetical protein